MNQPPKCPRCPGSMFRDAYGEQACINCGYSGKPPEPLPFARDREAPARLRPLHGGKRL